MPLSIQLGGSFRAGPTEPEAYDIPSVRKCFRPEDYRYMRLLDTRASEVLEHNPECRSCEHALQCLAGCCASALENHPADLIAPDPAACALFKGGWVEKIRKTMTRIDPKIRCRGLEP